jgi:hypothetical protein
MSEFLQGFITGTLSATGLILLLAGLAFAFLAPKQEGE